MEEININAKEVRKVAKELKDTMIFLKNNLDGFQKTETEIENSWKDKSASIYIGYLENIERQITKTIAGVESVAVKFENAADLTDKIESEISEILKD